MIWRTPTRYYLDFAASTPVSSETMKVMQPYWSKHYANPDSIHQSGRIAREAIERARYQVHQSCLMRHNDELVWTSGGSESNRLVIQTVLEDWKRAHPDTAYRLIISAVEHPSVIDYIESLQDQLLSVDQIPVSSTGRVQLDALESLLKKKEPLVLLSCIFQSSEVGTNQPIKSMVNLVRQLQPETFVHCDASQGLLYNRCNFADLGVDALTVCAQKIHGPKGVGAVLFRGKAPVSRPGTLAVPLIMGMAHALEVAQTKLEEQQKAMVDLRSQFFKLLEEAQVPCVLNGRRGEQSFIINLSFPGDSRDSEQLVVAFDEAGLEVSSKSACLGSQAEDSRVLHAMGVKAPNSIRLCLHHGMGKKDLVEIVKRISGITGAR